jgi:Lrp/AsnC family transcriptional regulator for asnA, asnC and gidA
MRIDDINKKILYLLQKDARMTYKDIARALNRSESTIRDRISIMEDEGVIKGYSAVINKEKVGLNCNARTFAMIDPKNLDACIRELQKIESVYQINQISGAHNLEFSIAATDYDHLQSILKTHVAPLGINDVTINIIINSVKEEGPIQIP